MTQEEILKAVQEIAAEELDIDASKVTMQASIKDDLDADSLDLFELVNELEDKFDVELETDEEMTTVGDVVNYVKAKVDEKNA